MIPLDTRRVRESFTTIKDGSKTRKIVVTLLRGDVIRLHLKGTQVKFDLTVLQAYQYAGALKGKADRAEKKLKVRSAPRR